MKNPHIAERNEAIRREWNRNRWTFVEIGAAFGMPRRSVARVLTEARQRGLDVLRLTQEERTARRVRSHRAGRAARTGAGTAPVSRPTAGEMGESTRVTGIPTTPETATQQKLG